MVILHNDNNFSVTNFFEMDHDYEEVEGGYKRKIVIKNIKKMFNFECNNYVTFNIGDKVTVILVREDKEDLSKSVRTAFDCEFIEPNKLLVLNNNTEINIKETLIKLKNNGK